MKTKNNHKAKILLVVTIFILFSFSAFSADNFVWINATFVNDSLINIGEVRVIEMNGFYNDYFFSSAGQLPGFLIMAYADDLVFDSDYIYYEEGISSDFNILMPYDEKMTV